MQNRELNELLCAAMINQDFCDILLSDPNLAIAGGYDGHAFHLSPEEHDLVTHIQAFDLADFAEQVSDWILRRARIHWAGAVVERNSSVQVVDRMGDFRLPTSKIGVEPIASNAGFYLNHSQHEFILPQ